MKHLYLLGLLCVAGQAGAEDWVLKISTDSMTDTITKEAMISSPTGESFTLLRRSDGSVWGYFRPANGQMFSAGDHLMVRVDKNKPIELNGKLEELMARVGKKMEVWDWNPTLIATRIWHGKVSDGCGIIQQLYNGQTMIVRNHPNESTYRDTTYTLGGNREALLQALDVDINACPPPKPQSAAPGK